MDSPIPGSVFADRFRWRDLSITTRSAVIALAAVYAIALFAPIISRYDPTQQLDIVSIKSQAPSFAHPFGTDRYSRDVLSRILFGARVSITVATLAVLVSAIVGTLYGLVAASAGAITDSLMMRVIDALLSIPRVLLLIAVLALWSPVPLVYLMLLLGFTGWYDVARLVRAEALSVREREFVAAARSLGASRITVMLRHLLPNVLSPVIVTTTLGIGNVIVLEAGLSYIGIGVREPMASLGTMFQEGTEVFAGTWWTAVFPGMAIVVIVLCVNIVGDALRSSLDPRQLPVTHG